jgi:hypothetical protein
MLQTDQSTDIKAVRGVKVSAGNVCTGRHLRSRTVSCDSEANTLDGSVGKLLASAAHGGTPAPRKLQGRVSEAGWDDEY